MSVGIPRATVSRFPLYLQYLDGLDDSEGSVSSDDIAAAVNVNAAKVRKDLSYLGSTGTRGVGYQAGRLSRSIRRVLGLTGEIPVAIVGAGNLGTALANYGGFGARGFQLKAIFDADRNKVGTTLNGVEVQHVDQMEGALRKENIAMAIIATPADAAQFAVERLAAGGVRSVLNFAPTVLRLPKGLEIRNVDLATELQILSYHLTRSTEAR